MQQPPLNNHHVSSPTLGSTSSLPTPPPLSRTTRLLYRRGLPDLPELIEADEDDTTTNITDDGSMNTFSTRHSASTSASSKEFPPWATFTAGVPLSPKQGVPPSPRPVQASSSTSSTSYEPFTQTPPSSVPQLQTPFEYNPSGSFRFNPLIRDEASPPPSPSPRDEALIHAGIGYGLGVNLTASGNFGVIDESGMTKSQDQARAMESSGVYGESECLIEGCLQCTGAQAPLRHPLGPYTQSSTTSGDVDVEIGEYMSPPSSPGSDYAEEFDGFYGLGSRSYPSLDRPRSPSLLLDNDAFSSVPTLPTFPPSSSAEDLSSESSRSRKLLGRKGTAVLNKVLPRSLRLKRWASTPALPKLQISTPPPLPRMPSATAPSPTPVSQLSAPPVPPNTAFEYDPYSDRLSDDEDDDETRRPTTRGTLMSREQLPTPPLLPAVAPTLPFIPPLDSPVSLSLPQSPSASVHNLPMSSQNSLFAAAVGQGPAVRNNSLTSLSNQSMPSSTPIPSPTTYVSPHQRPFDIIPPASTLTLNMSSLRGAIPTHPSPQLTQRSFAAGQPPLSEDNVVEDLFQQMELEDDAFAATEQRMATSGWSTETELLELRAKRQVVRREWEERIEAAKKQRRGSDGVSQSGTIGTMVSSTTGGSESSTSATPVITLPNSVGTTVLPSTPQF